MKYITLILLIIMSASTVFPERALSKFVAQGSSTTVASGATSTTSVAFVNDMFMKQILFDAPTTETTLSMLADPYEVNANVASFGNIPRTSDKAIIDSSEISALEKLNGSGVSTSATATPGFTPVGTFVSVETETENTKFVLNKTDENTPTTGKDVLNYGKIMLYSTGAVVGNFKAPSGTTADELVGNEIEVDFYLYDYIRTLSVMPLMYCEHTPQTLYSTLGTSAVQAGNVADMWQSFTVDDYYDVVRFQLSHFSVNDAGPFVAKIYEGVGIGGSLLASSTAFGFTGYVALPPTPGTAIIEFAGVHLAKGQSYTVWWPQTANAVDIFTVAPNPAADYIVLGTASIGATPVFSMTATLHKTRFVFTPSTLVRQPGGPTISYAKLSSAIGADITTTSDRFWFLLNRVVDVYFRGGVYKFDDLEGIFVARGRSVWIKIDQASGGPLKYYITFIGVY
jgi:hypothetical protein